MDAPACSPDRQGTPYLRPSVGYGFSFSAIFGAKKGPQLLPRFTLGFQLSFGRPAVQTRGVVRKTRPPGTAPRKPYLVGSGKQPARK